MFESIGVYFMLMMFISFPSDTDGRSRVQSVILGSSLLLILLFYTLAHYDRWICFQPHADWDILVATPGLCEEWLKALPNNTQVENVSHRHSSWFFPFEVFHILIISLLLV